MISYAETLRALGGRARELRVIRGYRQADLARRSGLSLPTIKRFEATGQASMANVLRIATALGAEQPFQTLFEPPKFRSLDEALAADSAAKRRRIRSRQ